ncbi:putative oxidoreductase-like protein, partial [Leptotrombidium deliense]
MSVPLTVVCDLTSEDEIKNLLKETIDTFGRSDVLVNNAVYYTTGNVLQPEVLQIWDNHCLVNVWYATTSRAADERFLASSGASFMTGI